MADLITSARAKYNLNNQTTTSDEDTTIAALVTACSKAIRRFCGREFDSQSFDELYNGNGLDRLLLKQIPVISVARVAFDPRTVLTITNTTSTNKRATVAVTASGLTLVRTASGTTTTDTSVTWAGNATITAVASAVNALGNGWSATVVDSAYSTWSSADLRAVQGAMNAAQWSGGQANIKLHVQEAADYDIDTAKGWLIKGAIDGFPGCGGGTWFGGTNFWRVIYTAGYATVPEDIQEACAQWVAARFWQTKRDPGLTQETIVGSTSKTPFTDMPPGVKQLILPYRLQNLFPFGG